MPNKKLRKYNIISEFSPPLIYFKEKGSSIIVMIIEYNKIIEYNSCTATTTKEKRKEKVCKK